MTAPVFNSVSGIHGLWHLGVEDEGSSFKVVLDADSRDATITVNDIIHHDTRVDDNGRFEVAPRWLPERVRTTLEAIIAGLVKQALRQVC